MIVSFIFTYAVSWNTTWNYLVRGPDLIFKYRCVVSQCEPPFTFN